MAHKIIQVAELEGTYGTETVQLRKLTDGRFKGKVTTYGYGYAGRIAYATEARAMAIIETDARFIGWRA